MTVYPDWKRPLEWSNEPIDLATRRIDELEQRVKSLSTRVYDLECGREKSEEALDEERQKTQVRLEEEREKAQVRLAAASANLFKAAHAGMNLEASAYQYRAARKRCHDLGLGLSE